MIYVSTLCDEVIYYQPGLTTTIIATLGNSDNSDQTMILN